MPSVYDSAAASPCVAETRATFDFNHIFLAYIYPICIIRTVISAQWASSGERDWFAHASHISGLCFFNRIWRTFSSSSLMTLRRNRMRRWQKMPTSMNVPKKARKTTKKVNSMEEVLEKSMDA